MYIDFVDIGFEIECLIGKSELVHLLKNLDHPPKSFKYSSGKSYTPLESCRESLSDFLNSKTSYPGLYSVVEDGSIISDSFDIHADLEIITKPLRFDLAMNELQMIFEFLDRYGFETNMSTGLHVNISFRKDSKYSMKDISIARLLTHYDDTSSLNRWGRLDNEFATPIQELFDDAPFVATSYHIWGSSNPDSDHDFNNKILSLCDDKVFTIPRHFKYCCVNVAALNLGYIEFRAIGGFDYHAKYDKVEREILNYINAMIKSTKKSKKKLEVYV